jgi:hypothetical protein
MTAGILSPELSLESILEHQVYTLARTLAHPMTAEIAKPFEQLVGQWWDIDRQETELWIAILKATAKLVAADDTIDDLLGAISRAILTQTAGKTDDPMYTQYYGTKNPSAMKRPVLGDELVTVRKWVPSLKASSEPALATLGTELEAAVAVADQAVTELGAAKQRNAEFRATGARRIHIDAVNVARKAAHGLLSQMPHRPEGKHLPSSFAERFFKRVRTTPQGDAPATAEALAARITKLEQELQALKTEQAELLTKEEREARRARENDLEALAAVEREAAEAAARATALRARLGV